MVANKVKGKIVFISSAAYKGEGMMGIGFNTYYIAAKAGVQAMTKGIAAELRQYDIGVNCVAPGGMLSHGVFVQGNKGSQMYGPDFDEVAGAHRGQTPLAMNPDQVALVVFALCTPMSDFMCGTTIDVDGGVLMNIQEKPFSFTIEGCVPGPKAE